MVVRALLPVPVSLRRSAFRSWLEARQMEIVGQTANEQCCPLANWLMDLYGVPCEVGYGRYWFVTDSARVSAHLLPVWAKQFIRSLDFTSPFEQVTGANVLRHLPCGYRQRERGM